MIGKPEEILKSIFGYDSFREGQETLIKSTLQGRDCLGIMPTGAGKSVCFQVPALLFSGITLVISPLISLMKDQVTSLNDLGVHAAYINSSLTEGQYRKAMEYASYGRYKLIYVAPERLMTESFLELARKIEISMVAVDEAHCISQWGQDFRPSYLKIVDFIEQLPKRPVIAAYTATATKAVKEDILCILGLRQPEVVVTGYDRKNLYFAVEKPKDKLAALLGYLGKHSGKSGIIYCSTRKAVEEIYEALLAQGCPVVRYHAGLSEAERRKSQEAFLYDERPVMVATNAFGMGIGKSNVRFVVHYNMPKDIESYYQEAGRAGRDGEPGECVLYYSGKDVKIQEFLIEQQPENEELGRSENALIRERSHERLRRMTFYCFTNECLRDYILRYFGEYGSAYCGNCKNCLTEFESIDVTEDTRVILEFVQSSGERYGIQAVVDGVHGSESAKVQKFRLQQNPYYGVLRHRSLVRLKQLVNDLLVKGCLDLTGGSYPILKLTVLGREILYGEKVQTIVLKLPKEREAAQRKKKTAKDISQPGRPELFELLRKKRYEMAQKAHVPPYIIFSDKTLREMSVHLPADQNAMLQINGVGGHKLAKYGGEFMEVIREYCQKNHRENGRGMGDEE